VFALLIGSLQGERKHGFKLPRFVHKHNPNPEVYRTSHLKPSEVFRSGTVFVAMAPLEQWADGPLLLLKTPSATKETVS
jgi:hypothetical protein